MGSEPWVLQHCVSVSILTEARLKRNLFWTANLVSAKLPLRCRSLFKSVALWWVRTPPFKTEPTAVGIVGLRESGDHADVHVFWDPLRLKLKVWRPKAVAHWHSQSKDIRSDVRLSYRTNRKATSQNETTSTFRADLKLESHRVYMDTAVFSNYYLSRRTG